jgi:hypothetical protein
VGPRKGIRISNPEFGTLLLQVSLLGPMTITNYSPAHHALHLGHSDDGLDDATRLAICDRFVEEIEIVKLN